jgi:hypothetical protein
MSDFLQSLVLRAAGLPLTATAAPRELPPAEPVESAPEEESAEVRASPAANAPAAPPVQRVAAESRRPPAPGAGAPPEVIEQFRRIQERTREVIHERDAPPQREVPLPVAPPAPPATTEIVERETIIERESEPEDGEADTPQLVVQPAPPPLEVPRETIVERETAEAPAATEPSEEPRQVVLQPIVLDQTRTIVEPVREEQTVIETHTERVVEPAPRHERAEQGDEAEPPRTIVQPRALAPELPLAETGAEALPAEAPRDTAAAADADEPEAATPRTVVLAPSRIPQAEQEQREEQQQPELSIHIGTIEIRAAAPPPPPAPAPAQIIQRAPEAPANFDDYTAVRNYIFPDVWR